ncbi:hypothetical protein [Pseudobutyrivibrio ruminis]|uniref:hypothetical protein n=1 Tax=Pseudobutyrivibrio ruminis TaxID=46206 RepID=UPI000488A97E|nr:hypothetical protein [Pseudobutyrivibrio ruminis]
MGDEKLRQEFLYMVKLTSKYDFTRMEVVEGILRLENEREILGSVFGKRFKSRIFDIAAGLETDEKCVICGQHADNHVICNHCMETIGDSDYAKNKIKSEVAPKKKLKIDIKGCITTVIVVLLVLILLFQIWILVLFNSIPDYNKEEKPRVSEHEVTAVSSLDDAYNQIVLDFPEEDGYTVTFGRTDSEYVGRFNLELGDCCLEKEDELTDEERYDYFFTEDVYVFYISYLQNHSSKVGIAEINQDGEIIIEGTFNDGRRTDSFYKFR